MSTQNYKYLAIAVIAFILGSMVTCHPKDDIAEGKQTKTEIKYHYVTRTDTIKLIKPVIQYKEKVVNITNTDTIIEKFNPNEYKYSFNKIIDSKSKRTSVDATIEGWGDISSASFKITEKDTIKTILTKETITKKITPNALYLGGSYDSQKKPGLTLDYTIKGKVMIGTQFQYDPSNNQPIVGGKIAIKL